MQQSQKVISDVVFTRTGNSAGWSFLVLIFLVGARNFLLFLVGALNFLLFLLLLNFFLLLCAFLGVQKKNFLYSVRIVGNGWVGVSGGVHCCLSSPHNPNKQTPLSAKLVPGHPDMYTDAQTTSGIFSNVTLIESTIRNSKAV